MLLDTHFHYDFLPPQERAPFVAELARRGACVVAQTLTPSAFVRLEAAESAHDAGPRLSVGYHPWHIGPDYAAQLRVFADALTRTRFVGEVGLDFAPRRLTEVPADLQTDVFRRLLEHIDATSLSDPHILSIHTVRSASTVLDLLESSGSSTAGRPDSRVIAVFHRFGGTSNELTRLIRAGHYLSVNPAMLQSKRGRAYLARVPADRLLLETDLPTSPDSPTPNARETANDVVSTLASTLSALANLRGVDEEDITAAVTATTERLYGVTCRPFSH
ncbi:TatD family hydrolase [Trueperella pyogenes]|uniref:TatD family hydrolase n=1 Tax=Trueperella pyogenes TaxID=1661 RepID=UPI00345D2D74